MALKQLGKVSFQKDQTLRPAMDKLTSEGIVNQLPSRLIFLRHPAVPHTSRERPDLGLKFQDGGWQISKVDFMVELNSEDPEALGTWVFMESEYQRKGVLHPLTTFILVASDSKVMGTRGGTSVSSATMVLPSWSFGEWIKALTIVCARHPDGSLMSPTGFSCALSDPLLSGHALSLWPSSTRHMETRLFINELRQMMTKLKAFVEESELTVNQEASLSRLMERILGEAIGVRVRETS